MGFVSLLLIELLVSSPGTRSMGMLSEVRADSAMPARSCENLRLFIAYLVERALDVAFALMIGRRLLGSERTSLM